MKGILSAIDEGATPGQKPARKQTQFCTDLHV